MKRIKSRILSLVLTAILVFSICPMSSYAAEDPTLSTDISKGAILIEDGTTADTIKVTYNDGAVKTVDDLPMNTKIILTGITLSNTVTVHTSATLADSTTSKIVDIIMNNADIQFNDGDRFTVGTCAVDVQGNSVVNLTLTGSNTIKSGGNCAGLQVSKNAELLITNSSTGTLNVTGGINGAGIGSGYEFSVGASAGKITVSGGEVTVIGGENGAGIGGGSYAAKGVITINGNAKVTATGGWNAAGIGNGSCYTATTGSITIGGSARVTATGGEGSAGIGGSAGNDVSGGSITITGGTITANGGKDGAGIGSGGSGMTVEGNNISITGGIITATGGTHGAGIGGGLHASGGNISISGNAKITAAGSAFATGIGGGTSSTETGSVKIDNTVTVIAASGLYGHYAIRDSDNTIEAVSGTVANILMAKYESVGDGEIFTTTVKDSSGAGFTPPITYEGAEYRTIAFTVPNIGNYTLYRGATQQGYDLGKKSSFAVTGGLAYFTSVMDGSGTPPATATYTVAYNANGGIGGVAAQTTAVGAATTVSANGFTRGGHTFTGWNTAANGSGTAYAAGASLPSQAANTTVTLFAQWQQAVGTTYTVAYNANGGAGSMAAQTTAVGAATTVSPNGFARAGHTFTAWNTAANGSGTAYAAGASIPSQTTGTTITLYAQWLQNTYSVIGTVEEEGSSNPVSGADVELRQGNHTIGTPTTTDAGGSFTITGVPNGIYNLIVKKGNQIITVLVVVNSANYTFTSAIKLPDGNTNSVLEIKPNTPNIVVGNLEQQFSQADKDHINGQPNNKVEIKLVANKKTGTEVQSDADKIAVVANGKTVELYLDLSVFKTLTTANVEGSPALLNTVPSILQVVLPLSADLQGQTGLAVYRVHNDIAEALQEGAPGVNGEYFVVGADSITIFTRNFSTYAVGYTQTTPPTPPTGGTIAPNDAKRLLTIRKIVSSDADVGKPYTFELRINGGAPSTITLPAAKNAEDAKTYSVTLPVGTPFEVREIFSQSEKATYDVQVNGVSSEHYSSTVSSGGSDVTFLNRRYDAGADNADSSSNPIPMTADPDVMRTIGGAFMLLIAALVAYFARRAFSKENQ